MKKGWDNDMVWPGEGSVETLTVAFQYTKGDDNDKRDFYQGW